MKKLVVFSNMYPSIDHPTFGIFVKNQVDLLSSTDLDVDVVVIKNPAKGKILTIGKYLSWFARAFFYLLKNYKKINLSHAHYAFPTGLISLMAKKILNIPYVVTVHGGDIDKMAAKNALIFQLTKKVFQEAEVVIVVGEKLENDVVTRFGIPKANIRVISMGVNTEIFKPIPQDVARQELGISGQGPFILYVGNVIESKGLLELIEAIELLESSIVVPELVIIGSQKDNGFVTKLKSEIEKNGHNKVRFLQPVGQPELAKWLAAAEMLILPSHHEGFGLAALEAMAVGTPVVASDVGGLSYLLKDGVGVLVQPKNVASLAEGIEKTLTHKKEYLSEDLCQQRVEKNSFETILQELKTIYLDVGRTNKKLKEL